MNLDLVASADAKFEGAIPRLGRRTRRRRQGRRARALRRPPRRCSSRRRTATCNARSMTMPSGWRGGGRGRGKRLTGHRPPSAWMLSGGGSRNGASWWCILRVLRSGTCRSRTSVKALRMALLAYGMLALKRMERRGEMNSLKYTSKIACLGNEFMTLLAWTCAAKWGTNGGGARVRRRAKLLRLATAVPACRLRRRTRPAGSPGTRSGPLKRGRG